MRRKQALRSALWVLGGFAAFLLLMTSPILMNWWRGRWPTEELARQVAPTTQVVASDREWGVKMVLSGQDATNLLRAISSAQGMFKGVRVLTFPSCRLQFFCQTNLLATIGCYGNWFQTDFKGEYREKSGVLEALQRRLKSDTSARQAWVNEWAWELVHRPEFGAVRDWSADLLRRYQAGELRIRKADDGPADASIPREAVPGWLRADEAYILKDAAGRPECIQLCWNEYGLILGTTNPPATFSASYMTNVGPGVIAFHAGKN